MSWWSRVANVFRSSRLQDDVDEEQRFHLESRTRALMEGGLPADAAAEQAAKRFGNTLRLREQSLDVKVVPALDSIVRDVGFGLRMLRKNATVTAAAVLSLGLALGACATAFSLVDALILEPLPVRHPEQLVYLTFPTDNPERPESETFNDPTFVALRDAARGNADLFAMSTQVIRPVIFADGGGEKEQIRTQYVSGDAFEQLGVTPAYGRLLAAADDDGVGAHPVAVVSHAYWLRRFGGDPAIIGRWFTLETRPFEIVGVAEPRFTGVEPGRPTDVWMPYAMYNPHAFGNFSFNWFRILGRVKEPARLAQASSVMQATFTNLRRERVESLGPAPSAERVGRYLQTRLVVRSAANGPSPLRRQFERSLWILAAIAVLVLIIAGSNVANLFLARTAAREREMALRLSIGAGRGRLIQQLLIESVLVAGAACALGLLFAAIAGPTVVGMLAPPDDPVRLELALDARLMAFAAVLTLLTTALFGLLPALRASDVAPISALKSTSRSATGGSTMRPFVAVQMAFGMTVVFVGGLLLLSFGKLAAVNPGFATSDVLLLSLDQVQRVDPAEQRRALFQVLDHVRNVPGVQAVSSAEFNLLGRAWTHYVRVPGTAHESFEATMEPVTSGYFETMKIPVLAGRGFESRDMDKASAPPLVVNQTFASRYFGGNGALGRTLDVRFGESDNEGGHEIVGVVADTRYDVRKPAGPIIYIPLRLRGVGTIHVRTAGEQTALAARLREEVRAANPLFRVTTITSQAAIVGLSLLRERLLALLAGFFAVIGLTLAAVGLFGVLSYSVVQRTREIGIRMALGARRAGVVRTVLADVGRATLVGSVAGIAGGLYLSRFVEALLFEVTAFDFWSLALPFAALTISAVLAALVPLMRASRVDPVVALRYE